MADRGNQSVDRRILLPGLTVVYINELKALELFNNEHTSRNDLHNVVFKMNFDLDKGR